MGKFSGLDKWLKDTKKFAYKNGYVETLFGRRRRLPDLYSKVNSLKSNAERQSINAPIQGTGSDLTLLSLIHIQNWIDNNDLKSKMIATVHDSIVFDVYIPELPQLARAVKTIMEHVHEPYFDTVVPIISELELGRSYGSSFDITIEDCEQLSSVEKFNKWEHDNSVNKYKKEISTLHSKSWTYEQVFEYLSVNNRPIKELTEYIIEVYSAS